MKPVKHKPCNTDIILKRDRNEHEESATPKFWCPTCERLVRSGELDRRGPYCVVTDGLRSTT